MIAPPLPANEAERLAALRSLGVANSGVEERFERLARLAAQLFNVPIALLTLVEKNELRFKARFGFDRTSAATVPRDQTFCAHALLSDEPLVVPDAAADPRFRDNPFVTGEPGIRFYAGQPIATPDGHRLGTLCIIDRQPRTLDARELASLRDLARLAEDALFNTDLHTTAQRLNEREDELRHTERQYRDIFENVACGISQTTRDGRYLNANPALARLLGYDSAAELMHVISDVGQQLYVHPELREELMQKLESCGDGIDGFECEMHRKDGVAVWVSQNVRRVCDASGRLLYFMTSYEDITSRRYAQAAQAQAADTAMQTAQLKSEFLSTMSHEIRTPMHGIIGMANLLLNTQLNDEQQELAKLIGNCGDNLLSLVNNILDFSKIESGGMEIHLAPFELGRCTKESLGPLGIIAKEKGVAVSCEIDPRIPPVLISDASWLRQIFNNLVSNALKFTPAGGSVEISITGDPLDPADLPEHVGAALEPYPEAVPWMFHFTVRDTGVGIAEEKLHRLFKPFSQADSAISRQYGGTGLGLAICHRLCEMLGGSIWLESEVGMGTSFEFTLKSAALPADAVSLSDVLPVIEPAEENAEEVPAPVKPPAIPATPPAAQTLARDSAAAAAPAATSGGGSSNASDTSVPPDLSILLVEDNHVNQRVARGLLRQHSYTADLAENGAEAVSACEKKQYDLVLMDVQMPIMDGLEATRRLRRMHGGVAEGGPYIIAMTANALAGDRERCLDAGMDEYVAKPVTGRQLHAVLKQAAKARSRLTGVPAVGGECAESGAVAAPMSAGPSQGSASTTPVAAMAPVPALPTESNLSPAQLDQDSLTALKNLQAEGDEGFVREIIELFLEDAVKRMSDLDATLAAGRGPEFTRAAHSIKGACANFGATDLAKLCAQIEAMGREGRLAETAPLLPKLRREFERVRLALEAEMARL